jgi:hypothetical protein
MIQKMPVFLVIAALFLFSPLAARAQDSNDVKVVPIGESIQPEKQTPAKKRRKAPATSVKSSTSFIVETATALSSGLTQEGETVYLMAGEDVGSSSRPAIIRGAPGRGTVTKVDKGKKELTVKFESIEAANGQQVRISGEINLTGQKGHAVAGVGERFTATLEEQVSGSRPSKRGEEEEAGMLTGFVEIDGKGARADLQKGKAGGKVRAIIEPPKGYTADDIDTSSIALYQVNDYRLLQPVFTNPKPKPKQADKNKNGTTDWTLYFNAWEFIKHQPKGTNTIHIKGTLKGGTNFEAVTRVMIGY